ncbi:MAG: tRNA uridine-5-carboxymethylaminomethyl(34) synthesis GTPase MnmE [Desulfovibrionaceae bacterium]|nr:tRNA uridine-5-carboxymethylaminomethyl(34) synthesis GTPase MnmE [Desulfovibrionaceae bacterium]
MSEINHADGAGAPAGPAAAPASHDSPSSAQTTIAALATAQGSGGIAIVRLSGPLSGKLLARLFVPGSAAFTGFRPWTLHHGRILDASGRELDDVLCVLMPGPGSYTGEDCAEIHCHGGQAIVSAILETLFACGAVPAKRGEFSRRAYLNGRMDLSQAEAVAELIAAPGREALEQSLRRLDGELSRRVTQVRSRLETVRVHMSLAVDFPDDEVEILDRPDFLVRVREAEQALQELLCGVERARVTRSGARVVLAGSVNAGKSSLMNALLGVSRALVTDVPGTTRDFIEESVLFGDLPVRLVDTAGLRDSDDTVESLGIERSREQIERADCLVLVVDGSAGDAAEDEGSVCPDRVVGDLLESAPADLPVLVLWNKADLRRPSGRPAWCRRSGGGLPPFMCVSALTGEGIDRFCETARDCILGSLPPAGESVAPNDRQARALRGAAGELSALSRDIEAGQLYDLLSVRLDMACAFLDDAIGVGTAQDVLNRVFESFCIGK